MKSFELLIHQPGKVNHEGNQLGFLPEITRFLVAQGAEVYAITPQRASLEEIFIETVGKDGGL